MKKYRLEYKEKTAQFHLDSFTHEENTAGWITMIEEITDDEAKLFFDFVEYGFPFKMPKYTNQKMWYKAQIFLRILNFNENN